VGSWWCSGCVAIGQSHVGTTVGVESAGGPARLLKVGLKLMSAEVAFR
jgi:hypothetical protein